LAFLAALRKRFDFSTTSESLADQVMAWLPAGLGIEDGASDPKWDTIGGLGRVFYLEKQNIDATSLGVAFAHEIAHNLGRRHPSSDGGCGAQDTGNTDWPYSDATVQEVGFWIRRSMIIPHTYTDLMSYCSERWISPHTYMRLFNGNFTPQFAHAQGAETNFLIISGTAEANGGGTLDPAYQVSTGGAGPVSNPNGNTCLRFSGASGDLGEFCFDLTFKGGEDGTPLTRETFTLKVPLPAGATGVSLMAGATELASLQKSAAAPDVQITSPAAGGDLSGQGTVTWSASDGDGDALRYTVLYSADGGATWLPIAVDETDPNFAFDVNSLEASANGMFRVLASDGLNTGAATVTGIAVGELGTEREWGDIDCSGGVAIGDAQKVARSLIGVAITQTPPCPAVGADITVGGNAGLWADVDCGGGVAIGDAQKLARSVIGLAVNKTDPCPDIGDTVLVAEG